MIWPRRFWKWLTGSRPLRLKSRVVIARTFSSACRNSGPSADGRELHRRGGRQAEEFYRERWRHDKVVRSTHGVNCTGSCSWQVYV